MNGIASSTATIARYLTLAGHSVTVITSDADGMPPRYVTEDGIEVHQAAPGNWHWYLSKFAKRSPSLIRYLKSWEIGHAAAIKFQALTRERPFDVVEVGPPTPWTNPTFRKFPGTKCVSFVHGASGLVHEFQNLPVTPIHRFWNYAEKESARAADGLLSPSHFVADFYARVYGRRPVVLPFPVRVPEPLAPPNRGPKIISLGGTGAAKGGDLIVEAMPAILRENSDVSLSVMSAKGNAGFETLEKEFPDRVSLLPWLPWDELQNEFLNHSIFISPSRFETFGLTVAEAMAVGLAVVVSDLPSHREIVEDGERGLTFRSGTASSLADALRRVVRDERLRSEMAGKGREWVQDCLQPETLIRQRTVFYEALFSNRARGLS